MAHIRAQLCSKLRKHFSSLTTAIPTTPQVVFKSIQNNKQSVELGQQNHNNLQNTTKKPPKKMHTIYDEVHPKYHDRIIDGKALADKLKEELRQRIAQRQSTQKHKYYEKPVLGYILVGNHLDSEMYVKLKKKACDSLGIEYEGYHLKETVSQQEINQYVAEMSSNNKISGILVQLPLPGHINESQVLDLIGPEKDVDGLHPLNIGKLAMKKHKPIFYSCTPLGCLKLIQSVCPNLEGKKVTICGRSNIVGMPLALLLNKQNATVSLCHSKTPHIQDYVSQADIFVSVVGKPHFFKGEWFRAGQVVIDVGINEFIWSEGTEQEGHVKHRKIVGDVEFERAIERCAHITPVPGGVGPMTIAMLMNNLVESWEMKNYEDVVVYDHEHKKNHKKGSSKEEEKKEHK